MNRLKHFMNMFINIMDKLRNCLNSFFFCKILNFLVYKYCEDIHLFYELILEYCA